MKKLLLLTLIPFMAVAGNFVAGPDSQTVYSDKAECEKFYGSECFDKGTEIDHTLTKLILVKVDDTTKPILSFMDPIEECTAIEPPVKDGGPVAVPADSAAVAADPIGVDPMPVQECHLTCEKEGFDLVGKQCQHVDGYEQKEVNELVLDDTKVAAREAEEAALKAQQDADALAAKQKADERAALKAKLQSADPSAEDIKSALKLLL